MNSKTNINFNKDVFETKTSNICKKNMIKTFFVSDSLIYI